MTSKLPTFSIKPVVAADILALAEISGASMETDKHTQLKAAHPTKPYDHAGGMVGAFEYWLDAPKSKVDFVKSVDNETGQILGFVCWGLRLGDPLASAQQRPEEAKDDSKEEKPSAAVSEDGVKATDSVVDPLAQLNEFTSAHLFGYQERVMRLGPRCMYVMTIAVHPRYQGRGVGKALLKHGTDRADSQGVFCWVHASEAGTTTFRKAGFEDDEVLEIDLDEPASKMEIKSPAGQDKWGTYTFTYMVRKPQSG